MDTIEEGILNALVCSAPNLQKLDIRHFGNKPFNYKRQFIGGTQSIIGFLIFGHIDKTYRKQV